MTDGTGALETLRREWAEARSDLMAVLGVSRKEEPHSAAIAWLLDPRGSHGLGTEFSSRFLATCGVERTVNDLRSATVACEEVALYSRRPCRADIVLRTGRPVVFEAKIDALDPEGQCELLVKAFSKKARGHEIPTFVFLTEDGRPPRFPPSAHGVDMNRARYSAVTASLRAALSIAGERGASGCAAAHAYLATLDQEFPSPTSPSLDRYTAFYLRNRRSIDGWLRDRPKEVRSKSKPKYSPRLTDDRRALLQRHEWLIRQWSGLKVRTVRVLDERLQSLRPLLAEALRGRKDEPRLWPEPPRPDADIQYLFLHRDGWRGTGIRG